MAQAHLTVNLAAIAANWRALDAMTTCETGAVLKADAYGLGMERVAPALAETGARSFFVALAEEGAALREILGHDARIFIFSGMLNGDSDLVREKNLIPLLNSPGQLREAQSLARRSGAPLTVGLQLDSGMNRLGFEEAEFAEAEAGGLLEGLQIALTTSHLACADEPDHEMNALQLAAFARATSHPALRNTRKSLAATGGVFLGADFHHDVARPGIGLYGGFPFAGASPVVTLDAPIIQIRDVEPGEIVGYGAAFRAESQRRIATLPLGYADGLLRNLGAGFTAHLADAPVRSVGRVSMDLITLDVTDHPAAREGAMVTLLGEQQGIDDLAAAAGTISYEILTSLGTRFKRRYRDQ